MSSPSDKTKGSRLRIAVVAAALGVAGCFTAAFTFADQSVQAAETQEAR